MAKYHKPHRTHSAPVAALQSIATGTVTPLLREDTGIHQSSLDSDVVERVHVIILVHGWIGCPQDLGYLHHAMEEQAAIVLKEENLSSSQRREPLYVYTCTSNHGRTNDGIQAGADRIAQESQEFLDSIREQHKGTLKEITLSVVGYSLGGLYSRYALPKIITAESADDSNNSPKIIPKVFCTIATPHLGSEGHTYVQLPRRLERWLSLMTQTGRDLFRHSNTIEKTITDPHWVEPMLRFEKRIAYANTYAMDVMVPTSTAAFIPENSTSEHFHLEIPNNNRFMALMVQTPAQHKLLREQTQQQSPTSSSSSSWDHAKRLDAMGWTKIFVDFADSYDRHADNDSKDHDSSTMTCSSSSERKRSIRAFELHAEFQRSKRRLFLPVGHDLVAVNSKNVFYSYFMRRGRPLIDQLANDFVRDVVRGVQQQSNDDGDGV
ncbi:Putative serine esterase (DUF676) [Seminavis robusta]|uniref:Serine esterase (DUF676) n=1 Tax=Seminavis robusta TaxID=568900 RepID=A0A9N8ENQ4_9STRA|nr:Putative serine esterase (DUF676) [Seminavis robusta]|eukprot:Sro1486_g276620.1 Putative serine esterase (DUF676) (435) ;mRNA; r:8394-9792